LPAVALVLVPAACKDLPPVHNRPPTLTITAGPPAAIRADTARFTWTAGDADGRVARFHYWLDDTAAARETESMGVRLVGFRPGDHVFYVRATDDSGAVSAAATWPFRRELVSGVPTLGTDTTLEIATWNLQEFPLRGESTLVRVRDLMLGLGLDVYALQEVQDTHAFRSLLGRLPGYTGLYSADDYGGWYQKTAVVYRTDVVEVSQVGQVLWGNDSVPRPPLLMTMRAHGQGGEFVFRLGVLHWKAGMGESDRRKRAAACRLLKEYLDAEVGGGMEDDFIVVGDWNDELDDPPAENVFQQFLDDSTDYAFLTRPLAGNSYHGSYVASGALIDHLLVTAGAMAEYAGGWTQTLRLDDYLSEYVEVVSDHRPVAVVFPVFRPRR
jgi:endonuclease/exonuclease/phosphatase family metal-dependent hydrolase